ncbi:Lid2 complex subunit [Schizosaccharomyces japonicus yFS275]|uniref:Lid2 complex subunit n=1 Tax=Schizosaccharomyces japonicus (strain yFS275 / FY16936) TaxID=402676 RepID=B6K4S3_SCHJY|nr:Lid2 complex subunit [Schizosaccharomyces japonicus yFS275]EEB08480.1 Lid2 complex subunit [Schizosaccharomyces japonicus yFS275]
MKPGKPKRKTNTADLLRIDALKLNCTDEESQQIPEKRPFGLKHVPCIKLSEKELADPFKVITSHWADICKYGAIKVVPPSNWRIPVTLDADEFRFRAKREFVQSENFNLSENAQYYQSLKTFHENNGLFFYHPPVIHETPVDFLQLRNAIGHFATNGANINITVVTKVLRELCLEDNSETRQLISRTYDRYIKPYERSLTARHSRSRDSKVTRLGGSMSNSSSEKSDVKIEDETEMSPLFQHGEQCENCRLEERPEEMLLCDGCEAAYHIYCLDPPLSSIPEDDWYCPICKYHLQNYDPVNGHLWTLRSMYDASGPIKESLLNYTGPITDDALELKFWELLRQSGSGQSSTHTEGLIDVESVSLRSSLPTKELFPLEETVSHPWNLHSIPFHPDSLFCYTGCDTRFLANTRMLLGLPLHFQNWSKNLYNTCDIKHHRFGDTVIWYIVSPKDEQKFAQLASSHIEGLSNVSIALHLEELSKHDITVHVLELRANEFMISAPNAFYFGLQLGFSLVESVYVGTFHWLRFGYLKECLQQMRLAKLDAQLSYEQLLFNLVALKVSNFCEKWAAPLLEDVMQKEQSLENEFYKLYPGARTYAATKNAISGTHCVSCGVILFRCRVRCACSDEDYCLEDAIKKTCSCGSTDVVLYKSIELTQLQKCVSDFQLLPRIPENWINSLKDILSNSAKPDLNALQKLLDDAEKNRLNLPEITNLKLFVKQANSWISSACHCLHISSSRKKRTKKSPLTIKSDTSGMSSSNDLNEFFKLIEGSETLRFSCNVINDLKKKALSLVTFRMKLVEAINSPITKEICQKLIEEGDNLGFQFPEIVVIHRYLNQLEWLEMFYSLKTESSTQFDLEKLISMGNNAGIPENSDYMVFVKAMKGKAEIWENQVRKVLSQSNVSYEKLSVMHDEALTLCVDKSLLSAVQKMLCDANDIKRRINCLYEQTKNEEFSHRPTADEVKRTLLEAERLPVVSENVTALQKMYDQVIEWIRRGKRLFGKANAPLEILGQHLEYVRKRNTSCFSLIDQPGLPIEPSSPENAVSGSVNITAAKKRHGGYFCFCRLPENGVMIECEVCREWYHAKCLKISKKKMRPDEKFTCPICDYRVEIPRLSNRPRLEELESLCRDVERLPIQPRETAVLRSVVGTAVRFRNELYALAHNPFGLTMAEVPIARFFLRKMEGAEILLADETNLFRQKLHNCVPIAPNPPPVIGESKSTRKPRPTKRQREIMRQIAEGLLPPSAMSSRNSHANKRAKTEQHPPSASPSSVNTPVPGTTVSTTKTVKEDWTSSLPGKDLEASKSDCICNQPFEIGDLLVSCVGCERHYHCDCVGLSASIVDSMRSFVCPSCMKGMGDAYPWQLRPRVAVNTGEETKKTTKPSGPKKTVQLLHLKEKSTKILSPRIIGALDAPSVHKLSCGEHATLDIGTMVCGSLSSPKTNFVFEELAEKNEVLAEQFLNV